MSRKEFDFEGNGTEYLDIIDLPHHRSATHPHMPLGSRAAQFSPFAALTGLEDAVEETTRRTVDEVAAEIERGMIEET